MERDYRKYVIALREVAKVGPKGFQQLLFVFGSPENIFDATLEEITQLPRMSKENAEEILKSQDRFAEIEEHISFLEEQGIGIKTILDEDYPQGLKQINNPPPLFYHKGEISLIRKLSVAVVGTHKATYEGIRYATKIGKELAKRDVVVISGLARGIDTAAHLGALAKQGKTYAVLGSGLNSIYPKENFTLATEISKSGALLTEYPLNSPVNVGQLIARNRIVVGLSQAVIVVESEDSASGTMNAVNKTIEQGKPLYAVVREKSEGFQELVSSGAIPIRGYEDLDLVLNYL
ncbi:MAG: DNA-protecting protein DprA [candidate division Zixibacteria bacterium]|nr:DNA-protecting protein DprA [candidate division Zixibacteria bacterium]